MTPEQRLRAWQGVALALGLYTVPNLLDHFGLWPQSPWLGFGATWAIGLAVLAWALQVEHLSPNSSGIRAPRLATIGCALCAVLATFALMAVYYRVLLPTFGTSSVPAGVDRIARMPVAAVIALCLTAGMVEEWLFRFYAIDRLYALTGSLWLASLMPNVVFVALHVPGLGLAQVIPVALGALVLTLLARWLHDYWCNALAHFLIDFSAFGAIAIGAHGG